ncbi:MAG: flagellar hook-length control protein FliK, partial [Solirubrobacteraceae bacterium]
PSPSAPASETPVFATPIGATPALEASSSTTPSALLPAPMQDTIDAIRATLEIAARQGYARARIELQPEELGHITVRLLQTSEGLRARLTADTPAGAQALAAGGSELRSTLTSMGVSLLHLDIGSSGQSPSGGARDFAGDPQSTPSATPALDETSAGEPALIDSSADLPPGPALGEIVDVLA